MNIARLAAENVKNFGTYDLFTYVGKDAAVVLTNVDIDEKGRSLATGLKKLGVKRGEVVCTVLTNVAEIPQTINGIMRMGAIFLPIIFALTAPEIRYIIEHSETRYVITENRLLPKIKEAVANLSADLKIIVIGNDEPGYINYADLLKESNASGDIVDVPDNELAMLMYTSGTTGFPKGVMLSHGNLESNMRDGAAVWPPTAGNRGLICLPMNHMYGLSSYFQACAYGDGMVMIARFDPEFIFKVIKEYKVNSLPMVPTMITMLIQTFNPEKHDVSSVGAIISSGGPLAEATLLKAMETLKIPIINAYGMTEAGPSITRQKLDRYKVGSVGPAIPHLEMKIVDENDREVPAETEGEIICKGPGVMKGYWKMPKETATTLRNGWLHSGDIGRVDEDGDLYITGRKKDLIIKGGENIDPSISEKWLYYHPAVSEAAVIGFPDTKYGEEVAAVIVLKPGQKASEQELIDFVREHVHHFSAPNKVFFVDDMPKNNMGKILKKELKKSLVQS
ncbi:MAG: AMP-binding protein [Dehalococcoidia bacterium]|nr:AMP-binding protein [Dehalococcoidia bacterium]